MASLPPVKLDTHEDWFNLLMTVLHQQAEQNPYEEYREMAQKLIDQFMRYGRPFVDSDHGVYYDSRIKLLLILLTSALAFALGGGLTGLLLFGVVCLFALLSGLWKTSIKVAIVYIVLLMLAQVLPIHLSSVITFFLLRILTIALALNILFQTTEISELIAALQASHIPQAIVIPVAIILRFLPSLKQDVLYIKQGMKTRGVGLSFWRIVSHPAQTYEGFLVPILMRLLMTATELSASAETRGISYPCEKTHYILVDFRLRDSILLIGIEETSKNLIMCLCPACANNFYGTGSYYLRRVHPGRVEKDICTYCGQRPGFDYEVVKKKERK